METMTVLETFEEYEGETRVRREKGEELSVSAERADELREKGLARKKPFARKGSAGGEGEAHPAGEAEGGAHAHDA